jgi:hypothetical protein
MFSQGRKRVIGSGKKIIWVIPNLAAWGSSPFLNNMNIHQNLEFVVVVAL